MTTFFAMQTHFPKSRPFPRHPFRNCVTPRRNKWQYSDNGQGKQIPNLYHVVQTIMTPRQGQ